MKDHEIAELVNKLTKDIQQACENYPQCLREMISNSIAPPLKKLKQENDELSVHVAALTIQGRHMIETGYFKSSCISFERIIDQTPKQSLAKIKADAIREAAPEIIKDFGFKARNHLRGVMRDHKYCDHPQVVGNFIDIYRKTYMELFLGEYADKLEEDNG